MKQQVINRILEEKIVVIVRGIASDKIIPLAEAMYEGGIRVLEITYNASNMDENKEVAANIKKLVDHFGDKMLIGAGTVLTTEQVALTKAAGGTFIISPNVDEEVIKVTCELGMVSIPGALTPTESVTAHNAGADFVKLFPITGLGSSYVKAVKAPLSHIRFLGVGGIDENNMEEYAKAGVCGFGIGSNIVSKKLVEAEDYAAITELAKLYTSRL